MYGGGVEITIETETVFTKKEMNNEWNVNFLKKIVPLFQRVLLYSKHGWK